MPFFTGQFTGDGAASKAITGVGFQPKVVQIFKQAAPSESYYTKTDQDGVNAALSDIFVSPAQYRYAANMIISLDPDGFTIGNANGMNALGGVYSFWCQS